MTFPSRRGAWLVGALSALGCGSSTGTTGPGPGGSGAGATTGSAGSGMSCGVTIDEPAGDLEVTVVNATQAPIFFEDELCGGPLVIAFDALPSARIGTPGCSTVPLDCTPNEAITIEPGAQASLSWEGLLVERVPTPDECYEGGAAGPIFCDRGVAPMAAATGTASFYYLRSCDDPSDYTSCSDQSHVDGTFSYEVGGALELTVTNP